MLISFLETLSTELESVNGLMMTFGFFFTKVDLIFMEVVTKKQMPRICTIDAPCKLNLHLEIGAKGPDGFHELESLFVPLALADSLCFEPGAKTGDCELSVSWEIPEENLPKEKNLVFRAVSLFRQLTGFDSGLRVRLVKRIPLGAGLGGGSSDAASCLLALNQLSNIVLPADELKKAALQLGSDVPFFLNAEAAIVSGRGEVIRPIKPVPVLWVVLVKPPIAVSTANAFRLLDEARAMEPVPGTEAEKKGFFPKLSRESIIQALNGEPRNWPFFNDFLSVNAGFNYSAILEVLREKGASFAGLSGSGSCCFGIFKGKKTAEEAEKRLSGLGNYVKLTFFLARRADPVLQY